MIWGLYVDIVVTWIYEWIDIWYTKFTDVQIYVYINLNEIEIRIHIKSTYRCIDIVGIWV